jgi:hypothetical protein
MTIFKFVHQQNTSCNCLKRIQLEVRTRHFKLIFQFWDHRKQAVKVNIFILIFGNKYLFSATKLSGWLIYKIIHLLPMTNLRALLTR